MAPIRELGLLLLNDSLSSAGPHEFLGLNPSEPSIAQPQFQSSSTPPTLPKPLVAGCWSQEFQRVPGMHWDPQPHACLMVAARELDPVI